MSSWVKAGIGKAVDLGHASVRDDESALDRCSAMVGFVASLSSDDTRFVAGEAYISTTHDFVPGDAVTGVVEAGARDQRLSLEAWLDLIIAALSDDAVATIEWQANHTGAMRCGECGWLDARRPQDPRIVVWTCEQCGGQDPVPVTEV